MESKIVSGIMLALLLIGMLTLAFNTKPVKAEPLEPPATEWSKTFGGISDDWAASIQQTNDGGYIIGGNTASFGAGSVDVWLVKIDSAGNVQWNRTYGDIAEDEGFGSVRQTSDGGYIFTGGFCTVVNGTCVSKKMWLIKTDSLGNQLWNRTDIGWSLELTSDGGYITAGGKSGDSWLLKMDENGNTQWERTYGGPLDEDARDVKQTSDGGYIVVGNLFDPGLRIWDAWVVKTDSTGNMQWNKTWGGADWEFGDHSVQCTSDGGYIIAGRTYSPGTKESDVWLVKADSSGNQQWVKTLGGAKDDGARSVRQTKDDGYIVFAYTESFGAGGIDFWLIKTDSVGNLESDKTIGGPGYDLAEDIQQTADGGYIVAGYTDSFGAGYSDAWVIKLFGLGPRTWTVDDDGPADFSSIQEAINSPDVKDGDIISVKTGIYYEHVVVNKTVSLIGEDRSTAIIDGSGTGTVVYVTESHVNISGLMIQNSGRILERQDSGISIGEYSQGNIVCNNIISNSGYGIYVYGGYNIVTNNTISNSYLGILLDFSDNNTVSGNILTNNTAGLYLKFSGDNTLRNNNMTNNGWNFGVSGMRLSDFDNDIDTSNLVDGKAVHYLVNQSNLTIDSSTFPDVGYLGFANSKNVTVKDLSLTKNGQGVLFAFTNYSTIENVNASNNYIGIQFIASVGNTVSNNMILNNFIGFDLEFADINTFYHNNFINNEHTGGCYVSDNVWDDGYPSGGNYWSDYTVRYPLVKDEYQGENQDVLGSDGIWDSPYEIDVDNQDRYPLVEPWSPLPRTIDELKTEIEKYWSEGEIDNRGIVKSLIAKLNVAQKLVDKGKIDEAKSILEDDFIPQVQNLSGIHTTPEAADILIKSAEYILSYL